MIAKRGFVFITADEPEPASKFGILFPSHLQGKPKTGLVVHHHYTGSWLFHGEDSLRGKRVVFDRWSGRPFRMVYEGKEYEFITVSQWAILAIIENEGD